MKIAIFAGTLNENQDGVTRVLFRQIRYFKRLGYEMVFFTPSYEDDGQLDNVFKIQSIPFPLYSDYKLSLPNKKRLLKVLEKIEPDIVFINSPCTLGWAAAKVANTINVPVVAIYHTHFPTYLSYYKISFLEPYVWRYMRYLYEKCNIVFVPSKSVEEDLNEKGITNTKYIPHGVDTNVFNPRFSNPSFKKELGVEGKKIVLFVGRIVKEKNIDVLQEAMNFLHKRDDFVLVIAGGGPYLEYYQKRMQNTIFLGHLNTSKLVEVYSSSDIFVFPSVTESFGNVILEAMACSLPPIVAKSFGASELIQDFSNGLLTEPNSAKDLADKIELLLENEKLRQSLSANAYSSAIKYSWENILNTYKKCFEGIIKNTNQNLCEFAIDNEALIFEE
ncbi:MAG: glycosyltransferase family 1 protein [Ignavibacteria bacterium]|nr:glycosyltransferase family 1 protein [Ignavibacteria bacterium]